MAQKTVVIFGVTGQIGSSAASELVKYFKVRGVTRDVNSSKAHALKAKGIEVIEANTAEPVSLDAVLDGAFGCFVLTNSDLTTTQGYHNEIRQGQAIADGCKRARVEHVVYSTQLHVVQSIGLHARHMDAKAEVFQYMTGLNLPVTALIVPCLYEHLLITPLRPVKHEPYSYKIGIPIGCRSLDMIGVDDIGPIVADIFANSSYWLGRTLSIVADKRTVPEIAAILSCYLEPLRFTDQQLTTEQFRKVHDFPGVNDYANQFDFYMRVNQRTSLDFTKLIHPGCQSFEEWVASNCDVITKAMDYPDHNPPPRDPWAC